MCAALFELGLAATLYTLEPVCTCPYRVVHGRTWAYMSVHGRTWSYMVPHRLQTSVSGSIRKKLLVETSDFQKMKRNTPIIIDMIDLTGDNGMIGSDLESLVTDLTCESCHLLSCPEESVQLSPWQLLLPIIVILKPGIASSSFSL